MDMSKIQKIVNNYIDSIDNFKFSNEECRERVERLCNKLEDTIDSLYDIVGEIDDIMYEDYNDEDNLKNLGMNEKDFI